MIQMPRQFTNPISAKDPATNAALQWVWAEIAKYVNQPFSPRYFEVNTAGLTTFPPIEVEELAVLKDTATGLFYLLYRDPAVGAFHTIAFM